MNPYFAEAAGRVEYLWHQQFDTDVECSNELAWALSGLGGSYGIRGDHAAAIESCELGVRMLRDRIDSGVGSKQDAADIPLLLMNLAGAHSLAGHGALELAALGEAVDRQRRVHDVLVADGDGWVLADMLHGFAEVAVDLGFNDEARSSLTEAEELLAEAMETRPRTAENILAQIEATLERLESPPHA